MSDRSSRRAARARAYRASWAPTAEAAEREIRRTKRRRYRRHRRRVRWFILLLALAVGWALAAKAFTLVVVRGTGMSPTVESGSVVLCVRQDLLDQLAGIVPEDERRVGRGDLVVLDYRPDDDTAGEGARLMKRVAGLNGDTIDLVDGTMAVNGTSAYPNAAGGDRVYPITVPARELFVIGDHLSVAVDSRWRAFGTVPESAVTARPLAVIWPAYAVGRIK